MFFKRRKPGQGPEYDEDFFKDTRMSFGDHLEELRTRMWRAIKGLALCLVIGFILDSIGTAVKQPWIGIGKPMLKVITQPVEDKVKEFYEERNQETKMKLEEARTSGSESPLTRTATFPAKIRSPIFEEKVGTAEIVCEITLTRSELETIVKSGESDADTGKGKLTGLGVMEAFMVYIKVSLLCGFIIACPWVFAQMWAFIGAGLYPHEKKLVHIYLPFSVILFIGGCVMCQFLVMPQAVKAMLVFYKWIDIDPDLRLNEWLGFAIVMPLVFGLAFQTPIVMIFLNRIGIFGWEVYLAKWRYAIFVMAILSALLTPSTDVVSMLFLFVPTFGLYMAGVWICYMLPPPQGLLGGAGEEEEEVGV